MKPLRVVGERGRAVLALGLVEIAGAWLVASAVVRVWTGNLASDPRGADALFAFGGRGVLDHLRLEPSRALHAFGVGAVGACAWAIVSVFLSGALPSLFVTSPAQSTLAAIARSFRRSGALILIALASAGGFLIIATFGVLSARAGFRATSSWPDVRHADLAALACLLPAFVLALCWSSLRDLAVMRAMDETRSFGAVVRAAFADFRARPGSLAVGALAATTVSLVVLALAAWIVVPLEPDRIAIALLAVAVQQALAIARIGVRATWFAHLATSMQRSDSPGIPVQRDQA